MRIKTGFHSLAAFSLNESINEHFGVEQLSYSKIYFIFFSFKKEKQTLQHIF